ncbi:hypothetical protein GB937_001430 [Aspergillus fischeri]|nr:hypothetical protein GB937_001430 [Aspergillus fischeri]
MNHPPKSPPNPYIPPPPRHHPSESSATQTPETPPRNADLQTRTAMPNLIHLVLKLRQAPLIHMHIVDSGPIRRAEYIHLYHLRNRHRKDRIEGVQGVVVWTGDVVREDFACVYVEQAFGADAIQTLQLEGAIQPEDEAGVLVGGFDINSGLVLLGAGAAGPTVK